MTGRSNELQTLARGIQRCRRCRLHERRKHAVPGEGPVGARLLLIGEAPGRKEDETGRPFMGAAGRYLDNLLEETGFRRAGIFITSCVKCRPPGNRNPHVDEVQTCLGHWMGRQIEVISPSWVVLLGRVAAAAFLGGSPRLKDLHGRPIEADGRKLFVSYHPAAGMRFPDVDRAIQADFRILKKAMER